MQDQHLIRACTPSDHIRHRPQQAQIKRRSRRVVGASALDQLSLFSPHTMFTKAVAEVPPSLSSIPPSLSGDGAEGVVLPGGTISPDTCDEVGPIKKSFAERVAEERAYRERIANAQPDDCVLLAAKVFPYWPSYLRDPYIRKLAADHPRACYIALCRAKENRRPILRPWTWLSVTVRQIEQEKRSNQA